MDATTETTSVEREGSSLRGHGLDLSPELELRLEQSLARLTVLVALAGKADLVTGHRRSLHG